MDLKNVQVERGEGGQVTLKIEVAPETVKIARDGVIKDLSRRIRVPGFRPGHIPSAIVRRQVGDEAIAQNVSDKIVPEAYQAALQETGLQPLDRAQVDELSFEALSGDTPLTFTARVIVRPSMEIEYSNLQATQPRVEVTDDDIEKGLAELQRQRAHFHDVEGRGAQNGDVLNAELRVFIDGEERGETPGTIRGFALGESGFVPNIDEDLVGAQLDEERRFSVTYPDDFKDAELAGKSAEFLVKITALKETHAPELNDEFAQTLGMDDMNAVRERMRAAIQEGRERESGEYVRAEIMKQLVEKTSFQVPPTLLEGRAKLRVQNVENELATRGGTLSDYLKAIGKTSEEFDADVQSEVESEMKQELILDEIAQREGLQASQNELESYYYQAAQAMQQPIERVVERLDIEAARASILQQKALQMLVESAQITEIEPLPIEADELEIQEIDADDLDDDIEMEDELDDSEIEVNEINRSEIGQIENATIATAAATPAVVASATVAPTTDAPAQSEKTEPTSV